MTVFISFHKNDKCIIKMCSNSNDLSNKIKFTSYVDEEQFRKPFEHGWKREVVYRNDVNKLKNPNVFYIAPSGKKLHNKNDIKLCLEANTDDLHLEMFTFVKKPIGHDNEIIRTASVKGFKRVSEKPPIERKLGKKDDVCIESSDAELDSKIDLFKSINESCLNLHRIIDSYQERIIIVAQEENSVGKFLKETGKGSATSGKPMNTAGKSLSYCGQQRMMIRAPLMRLHHELDTFRNRAISDTHQTIQTMERERTEYRAALNWMKSASAQLDPDTGRGLEKFRKAQHHVRASKTKFDKLTLDCLQKIDLLAAARCNMFSHVLVAYQSALLEFANKTMDTFKSAMTALEKEPHYSFTILKELTQGSETADNSNDNQLAAVDSDQMLFFKDDYKDDVPSNTVDKSKTERKEDTSKSELIDVTDSCSNQLELLSTTMNIIDGFNENQSPSLVDTSSSTDLLKMMSESDFGDFVSSSPYLPSQLLMNDLEDFSFDNLKMESTKTSIPTESSADNIAKKKNSILQLFHKTPSNVGSSAATDETDTDKRTSPQKSKSRKDKSAWFELFADLDPLANPESLEKKLSDNSQAA